MPSITVVESAAASAVGTNLMAGNREQSKPRLRQVTSIGLVGSAAVRDAAVQLFYGDTFIGEFFNTTAGANVLPLYQRDIVAVDPTMAAEPGEPINLLISDAGLTNVLVCTLEISEIG